MQSRYAQLARLLDDAMMRLATHEVEAVQQIVNTEADEELIAALPSERRFARASSWALSLGHDADRP